MKNSLFINGIEFKKTGETRPFSGKQIFSVKCDGELEAILIKEKACCMGYNARSGNSSFNHPSLGHIRPHDWVVEIDI